MGANEYYAMKRSAKPRTFEARYTSRCPVCDELIHPGDLCRWDRENVFQHADCEPPPDAPTTEVCGTCFLAVAVSGACGCEPE